MMKLNLQDPPSKCDTSPSPLILPHRMFAECMVDLQEANGPGSHYSCSPDFSVPALACFLNSCTSSKSSGSILVQLNIISGLDDCSSLLIGLPAPSPGLLQPILLTVARATLLHHSADHIHISTPRPGSCLPHQAHSAYPPRP